MSSHRTGTDLLQPADHSSRSRSRGNSGASNGGGATAALLTHQNLLRLALKRPTEWQWELTTSSSSPNIHFPRIQLYDGASGELMVEVDRPDCVIRSAGLDPDPEQQPQSSSTTTGSAGRGSAYRRSRTTLVKERLATSGDSLADIFNQLRSKGLGHKLSTSGSQYRVLQKSQSTSVVVAEPEQPEPCQIPRRRSRRRSVASRSSSILGRISEFYGRTGSRSSSSSSSSNSSTATSCSIVQEEQQKNASSGAAAALPPSILILPPEELPPATHGVMIEEVVEEPAKPSPPEPTTKPKIYKLVRSNAGTLMVREESFHTQRSLRRRQRQQAGLPESSPTPPPPAPAPQAPVSLLGDREPSRYEPAINHIDRLLSQVMLRSQDLPEERPARPVRPDSPASHRAHRARRRRSASVTTPAPTPSNVSPVRRSAPLGPVRRSSSSSPASGPRPADTVQRSSRRSSHQRQRRHRRSSSREPGSTTRAPHDAGSDRAHGHASDVAGPGSDDDGAHRTIERRSGSVRGIASIADLPPTIAVSALAVNGSSASSSSSSSSALGSSQPSAHQSVKESAKQSVCNSVPGSPSSGFASLGHLSSSEATTSAAPAPASGQYLRASVSSIKSHRSTSESETTATDRRTMQRPKPTHGHKRSYSCLGGSAPAPAPAPAPAQPSTSSSSSSSSSSSPSYSFAQIVELARKPPTGASPSGATTTTTTETFRKPAPPATVPVDGEERPPSYAEAVRQGASPPPLPAPVTDAQRAAELSSDTRRRWQYYARKHHRTSYQDTP